MSQRAGWAKRRRPGASAALAQVSAYLTDVRRHPMLTREEEVSLARRARAGDSRAAQALVTANLRFVVAVALDFSGYRLPLADLIQEGNEGLVHAVKKFDPERGVKLNTYAIWWIRAYIQNYILKSWSLVKLGTTQAQRKLFFSLARTRRELEKLGEADGGTAVNVDDIAKKLRVKPQEVREMEQRLRGDTYAGLLPATDGWPFPSADAERGPEAQFIAAELGALAKARVRTALADLPERERVIAEERLMADERTSLVELGERFGCSRELVRQVELKVRAVLARALADLRVAA